MWLLNTTSFQLDNFEGDSKPPYAILSHRWQGDEVTFKQVLKRRTSSITGWHKVRKCCEQAREDGYSYAWIDTCCIDRKSSAELSEAINSMYQWYQRSDVCYAYLHDVVDALDLTASEWFTRGWTLQELLAPRKLIFMDCEWKSLGSREDHSFAIEARTGISRDVLNDFDPQDGGYAAPCIAQKMAWAAGRRTTRVEDRAYSLLGIFGVHMPLLYGEGEAAFYRLQEELMKSSNDLSLFAWRAAPSSFSGVLAKSPDAFADLFGMRSFEEDGRYTFYKHIISGFFFLYHYEFDLHLAILGSMGDKDVCTVLREIARDGEKSLFQPMEQPQLLVLQTCRTCFNEGESCSSLRLRRRSIEIRNIRPKVSWVKNAWAFDSKFGGAFFGQGTVVVRPGLLFPNPVDWPRGGSRWEKAQPQPFEILWANFDHHSRTSPIQCLCIGTMKYKFHREKSPTAGIICYFGINENNQPTVLASRILSKTAWQPEDVDTTVSFQQDIVSLDVLPISRNAQPSQDPSPLETNMRQFESQKRQDPATLIASDQSSSKPIRPHSVKSLGTLVDFHFYASSDDTFRVRLKFSNRWDIQGLETLPTQWLIHPNDPTQLSE